jgi:hypothetical protein
MKSALYCFTHAVRCDEMACASDDVANRRMLQATARIWRQLGEASEKAEAKPHRFVEGRPARED